MNWKGGFENRPDWDTYLLSLAFVISQRSCDPSTACGGCAC